MKPINTQMKKIIKENKSRPQEIPFENKRKEV